MKFTKSLGLLLLIVVLINCDNNIEHAKVSNKKKGVYKSLTKQSVIYTNFSDTIIRYYPDKTISDSLAVVEGLKTKVFGIAISNTKKNIYVFLNDSTFFTMNLERNRHIHLFKDNILNKKIKKYIYNDSAKPIQFIECDLNNVIYNLKNDTISYSFGKRQKLLEYVAISKKGLGLFDMFDIGMNKSDFFNNLGFNDVPVEGDFIVSIVDVFNHMKGAEQRNWFQEYLPKLSKVRNDFGRYEIEYRLIFKNNKIVRFYLI